MAARDIRALPKLEGTAHVNMALVVKFMANFLFDPAEYPEVPKRDDPADDAFFFHQGPAKGLGKVRFHDYRLAYDARRAAQRRDASGSRSTRSSGSCLRLPRTRSSSEDVDFLLSLGEVFTLVPYGQLDARGGSDVRQSSDDLVDQIFDVMVRDLSRYALQLAHKPSTSAAQQQLAMAMIRKPAVDRERFLRVWNDEVYALVGAYEMNE